MTLVPVYGCVGCSGPGGRLSCPEHGYYEVVERDAEIARLLTRLERAERVVKAMQQKVERYGDIVIHGRTDHKVTAVCELCIALIAIQEQA